MGLEGCDWVGGHFLSRMNLIWGFKQAKNFFSQLQKTSYRISQHVLDLLKCSHKHFLAEYSPSPSCWLLTRDSVQRGDLPSNECTSVPWLSCFPTSLELGVLDFAACSRSWIEGVAGFILPTHRALHFQHFLQEMDHSSLAKHCKTRLPTSPS